MPTEELYKRAAAAGGVGIWDWNLATGEIYVDPVLKEMLGYADHEIRSHLDDWGRLVHPDDAAAVLEQAEVHIAGKTPFYELEHRMRHRDGSVRWFLARGSVIRNAAGTPVRLAGTDTDITERKRSEEALRQAEEINKRIVESTGDCLKILDLDSRVIYMNREGLRFLEVDDISQVPNVPIPEFFEGEARRAAEDAVAAARSGRPGRFQGLLQSPSGRARWFDIVVTPITDVNGAVVQLLAVSRDITERRLEEALRVARHQVLAMIGTGTPLADVLAYLVRFIEDHANGMVCSVLLLDDDGLRVRHVAAPSLPREYVQMIDGSVIGPGAGSCGTAMHLRTPVIVTDILTDPLWENYRDAARRSGQRACWSTPIVSVEGHVLGSFAMYYAEPRSPGDEERQVIESAADIARIAIEHDHTRQALEHSEARNRAILRAIPDWMFLMTVDGVFLDYHAREPSRLHAPPSAFLGKRVTDVLPHPIGDMLAHVFARVIMSDEPETVEYTLGTGDDERFYEACIVRCDGDKILSIVRDVTKSRRAELETEAQRREVAHLGRVAMLGGLSGALAHELSQPLTAVRTNAQAARLLLNREPLDLTELRGALDDIISNNKRASWVIERLRALLRKEDATLQPVNVNEVVRDVIDLARSEILARRITLTSQLAPDVRLVLGDRVQLQQVVLNLVLNACDAMSGTLAGDRQVALATGMEDGFVQVVVSDKGPGIAESQLERVFEPFVTFREQGLGLGLAISRSIVTAHRGSIRAENNAGGGATFRCFLPVADDVAIQGAEHALAAEIRSSRGSTFHA